MEKIKVALIGHGHLGKFHAQKISTLENAQFYSIVEVDQEKQKVAKELYPDVLVVSNLDEIIDEIDAAVVVTHTSAHFEVVKELLTKKKHVFCEKPITATLKEANELVPLVENSDLVLQVGHSERFHKCWEYKKEYPNFSKEAQLLE